MKINVITLHRVRNYGSSLQTLALQKVLEDNKCQIQVIDYYPERYTSWGLLKRLKGKSKHLEQNPILLLIARMIISISYIKKKIVFDDFLKKYINLTEMTYRNEKELLENLPQADAYCTGSDQVWNSHWNEGIDKPLYLSFVKKEHYKFSYASSIGNAVLELDEGRAVKSYLEQYNRITVREDTGVGIIKKLGFEDVKQMLDPTLLLNSTEWSNYVSNKFSNRRYVVTYNLHHDKKIDRYANELAKANNLEVYHISYNLHDIIRRGKLKWCPTIEEYLGLIRDAEYVITDSFHATVFSIIFNKKFVAIYPEQASTRIKSLLHLLDIEDRGTERMPCLEEAYQEINYSKVEQILNREREKAKEYIRDVLKDVDVKMNNQVKGI